MLLTPLGKDARLKRNESLINGSDIGAMGRMFKACFVIVAALGVLVIVISFMGMNAIDRREAMSPAERAADEARYEAQKGEEAKARLKINADGHLCLNSSGENADTISQLKQTLRDPDSFVHMKTSIGPVLKYGKHPLIMKYRAKNGFGGYAFGTVEALVDNADCSAAIVSTASR